MSDYAIVIAGGRIEDDFALGFLISAGADCAADCAGGLPALSTPAEKSASGRKAQRSSEADAKAPPLLIAADRGLAFLDRHGIVPVLVVGDFDSAGDAFVRRYLSDHPQVEVHRFGWEKDYTDTEIAVRMALEKGCRRIDLLGTTGTRVDHMLGSVQLLAMLLEEGAEGRILDPCNRISMHREGFQIRKDAQWGKYVSFFAWGGAVGGLTLTGFHFPMKDGTITQDRTIAVSNQIEEETARVSFRSGTLLMVESKDTPDA